MLNGKPFILGINASPFVDVEKHNCARALNTALMAALQTGAEVEIINLGQILHDDGRRDEERFDLETRIAMLPIEGNLHEVVHTILKADGVIFATPTRNFALSSRMAALFSWLQVTTDFPDYALAGKVAAFMSVCEEDGAQSANEKMWSPAGHLGFATPPFPAYFFNKNAVGSSEGDWQTTDLNLVGLNVRRMVQIMRGEMPKKFLPATAEMWNDDEVGSW